MKGLAYIMGIPFETLIIPSIIFIMLTIYMIQDLTKKIKPKTPRIALVGVVIAMLFSSLSLIETMLWIASLTGLYKLPMSAGNMRNVVIVERLGGESLFSLNMINLKINNSYNDLLEENDYCEVSYTPITRHVISLIKLNK